MSAGSVRKRLAGCPSAWVSGELLFTRHRSTSEGGVDATGVAGNFKAPDPVVEERVAAVGALTGRGSLTEATAEDELDDPDRSVTGCARSGFRESAVTPSNNSATIATITTLFTESFSQIAGYGDDLFRMYSADEATREIAPAPTELTRLRHRFYRKVTAYNGGAKLFIKVEKIYSLAVVVTHYITCNGDCSALSGIAPF